jgi:hypothetical protein
MGPICRGVAPNSNEEAKTKAATKCIAPDVLSHPSHTTSLLRSSLPIIKRDPFYRGGRAGGADRGGRIESMDHKPCAAVLEPLLPSPAEGKAAEAKRLMRLAGPIVASCVLQNVVSMASIIFVGHLGELHLAGASLATSLANVTGYSLLVRPRTDRVPNPSTSTPFRCFDPSIVLLPCLDRRGQDRHGERAGHAVRAGVRRAAAPPPGRVQAARDGGARARLRPDRGRVGVRRPDPAPPRPGPADRGGGRRVRAVAHPVAGRLRAAAVPRPLPADAERGPARGGQLRRHGALPRAGVLGAGVQGRHGQQGRRAQQRRLLRRQPRGTGAVREAVGRVQGDMERLLAGGV